MTPLGRQPALAGQISELKRHNQRIESKWPLFRELTKAQKYFAVNDRDLTVLNALLSFHPSDSLGEGGMVVFPSNKSLMQRAHGMPESTLRRHLVRLVNAGLIDRQDSPNGKRYARRGPGGVIHRAFGFSLNPLLTRADEIRDAVVKTEMEQAKLIDLREGCLLSIREAKTLLETHDPKSTQAAQADDALRLAERALRRKPEMANLMQIQGSLRTVIHHLHREALESPVPSDPSEMSANDVQNERHNQRSNTEIYMKKETQDLRSDNQRNKEYVTYQEIAQACPDILEFSPDPINSQREMFSHVERMSRMMGVQTDLFQRAINAMGRDHTTATLAAILQRSSAIKAPPAYFAALVKKAENKQFTPKPMLKRLLAIQDQRISQAS